MYTDQLRPARTCVHILMRVETVQIPASKYLNILASKASALDIVHKSLLSLAGRQITRPHMVRIASGFLWPLTKLLLFVISAC